MRRPRFSPAAFSWILPEKPANRAGEDPVRPTFLSHEVVRPEKAEVGGGSEVDRRYWAECGAAPGVEPFRVRPCGGKHGFRWRRVWISGRHGGAAQTQVVNQRDESGAGMVPLELAFAENLRFPGFDVPAGRRENPAVEGIRPLLPNAVAEVARMTDFDQVSGATHGHLESCLSRLAAGDSAASRTISLIEAILGRW